MITMGTDSLMAYQLRLELPNGWRISITGLPCGHVNVYVTPTALNEHTEKQFFGEPEFTSEQAAVKAGIFSSIFKKVRNWLS